MLKKTKVQLLLVLAGGVLLGYLVASGGLSFKSSRPRVADGVEGVATAAAVYGQSEGDEEAITFEVVLPADAVLEIDDVKTKTTGTVRKFRTPPVATGNSYLYTLKATAGDKTVTRQVHLRHGGVRHFDLREEFGAGSAEATKLEAKP